MRLFQCTCSCRRSISHCAMTLLSFVHACVANECWCIHAPDVISHRATIASHAWPVRRTMWCQSLSYTPCIDTQRQNNKMLSFVRYNSLQSTQQFRNWWHCSSRICLVCLLAARLPDYVCLLERKSWNYILSSERTQRSMSTPSLGTVFVRTSAHTFNCSNAEASRITAGEHIDVNAVS